MKTTENQNEKQMHRVPFLWVWVSQMTLFLVYYHHLKIIMGCFLVFCFRTPCVSIVLHKTYFIVILTFNINHSHNKWILTNIQNCQMFIILIKNKRSKEIWHTCTLHQSVPHISGHWLLLRRCEVNWLLLWRCEVKRSYENPYLMWF